jgi:ribosomal protein S18 acetylase RimI-like enzyme
MTVDAQLCRLGPDDAGEVLTLQRAGYVTEAQLHDDPRIAPLLQTLDELRTELEHPGVIAIGLREDGRLVAAVRLKDLGHGRISLGRLVVAPDRQRAGHGTRLLLEAEKVVPGTREIDLFTGELSALNLHLYRRNGYVETHRTSAGTHDLVHLRKSLG